MGGVCASCAGREPPESSDAESWKTYNAIDPAPSKLTETNTTPLTSSDVGSKETALAAGFVQHEVGVSELLEKYDLQNGIKIGSGSFGSVIAVRRRSDYESFALKCISYDGSSDTSLRETLEEVAIQKCLDHPNIAKIYETYVDRHRSQMFIVMCDVWPY